ncbi:MAG: peptide chain release factor 3 [Oligoflexales bacterium]
MSSITQEIQKRRTFAIISHPDAGKTTITEKLLLYGGAINMAGTVKAKRSKKFATSDWMELEKQRGISVTSSVMSFPYNGYKINLIDTPGHQDFSEDTYRTLTAVDSVLMLIDAAKGVEEQTKKLFEVCKMQKTPVIAFINKMDKEARDPFELLHEIENILKIQTCPVVWPIGMGDSFKGVYNQQEQKLLLYSRTENRGQQAEAVELSVDDSKLDDIAGPELAEKARSDIELLSVAGETFSQEKYLAGELAPVFFGSALNNFGIEPLLQAICDLAPPPTPRETKQRLVQPDEEKFSAFIFKIQANMDPNHRDRVAFIRICAGKFERGMKAFLVRSAKEQRLGRPTQFMAQDRSLVDEAFAGDIVGIHDPGVFRIGDSISEGEQLQFTGIPVFAPEKFVRVVLKDPLKSKQLHKALNQLSEEGAVQVFRPVHATDQILGVVGELQFDVVSYRIKNEYGVNTIFQKIPYSCARWISCDDKPALETFLREQGSSVCLDQHDQHTILLDDLWRLNYLRERYPKVQYRSISENVQ